MTHRTPRKPAAAAAPASDLPDFMTIAEVADLLRVSERKLWREIADGRLKVYRFGGSTRVASADLNVFIQKAKS